MNRCLYKKRFLRPLRRQFDVLAADDEDEFEVILGDGTDKQASEIATSLKPARCSFAH